MIELASKEELAYVDSIRKRTRKEEKEWLKSILKNMKGSKGVYIVVEINM